MQFEHRRGGGTPPCGCDCIGCKCEECEDNREAGGINDIGALGLGHQEPFQIGGNGLPILWQKRVGMGCSKKR